MTLGQRICSLRRERKLSQETVAEKLNVSRQAVSKWENDQSAPDTENLILLAKLLETDVEFLATGQLPEDLEPEPLPEPAEEPKLRKERKDRKKPLTLLLALSLLLNAFLFGCLKYEQGREKLLEQCCVSFAYGAKTAFADYAHDGKDANYWQGVAEFRGFMQSYRLLTEEDSGGEYNWLSRLYASLVFDKDKVTEHIEQLRKVMRLLSEDYTDANAFEELSRLNNEIEHGT